MTIYITRSYNHKIEDSIIYKSKIDMKKRKLKNAIQKYNSQRPSNIFDKMFENSTPWMGYSDPDTVSKNISKNAPFNSNKYSTVK